MLLCPTRPWTAPSKGFHSEPGPRGSWGGSEALLLEGPSFLNCEPLIFLFWALRGREHSYGEEARTLSFICEVVPGAQRSSPLSIFPAVLDRLPWHPAVRPTHGWGGGSSLFILRESVSEPERASWLVSEKWNQGLIPSCAPRGSLCLPGRVLSLPHEKEAGGGSKSGPWGSQGDAFPLHPLSPHALPEGRGGRRALPEREGSRMSVHSLLCIAVAPLCIPVLSPCPPVPYIPLHLRTLTPFHILLCLLPFLLFAFDGGTRGNEGPGIVR